MIVSAINPNFALKYIKRDFSRLYSEILVMNKRISYPCLEPVSMGPYFKMVYMEIHLTISAETENNMGSLIASS